ncbi:hypothetical protein GCM10022277_26190 [Litoribacillus peritrichatus]|uniref:Uncharacterized protein n=2 Tax=Litoribacillus peritrichatus TaxID=718191 RepID=A0ABP7MUS5_9GAMM
MNLFAEQQPLPLDGKAYIGSIGYKGSDLISEKDDVLTFKDGKFYSATCKVWGFDGGQYSVEQSGDTIKFKALTSSEDHGQIEWEGTISGDEINATLTWTKERWWWTDAREEKWFRGNVK